MESRFILGQQALTPDGAVYQIIWDEPYNEIVTPDIVVNGLITRAPEDTVAGSTCIFNTEDADGYPVEWLFAFDGTNWALDRVIRGGSAGGSSEYKTAQVEFLLQNIPHVLVSGAFTDPSGYVFTEKNISSSIHGVSVLCANNGAPSELSVPSGYAFVASQGNIRIQHDDVAYVQGDGTITIGEGGGK